MQEPERWERVAELFEAVLTLPPEEREAFLGEACGGDAELEREVLALIEADAGASHLFSGLRRTLVKGLGAAAAGSGHAGRTVGAYTLEEEIGRGGMGEVYRARRTDRAYDARVAVKILGGGPLTDEGVRRFHRERQILASLDHPAIARLLDGGTTADGRPYLVMEHVEGVPIDVFCDRHRLGIADRLRLVRRVCSAVQRAHQSLVVHRDLKPANVLVTGDGEPKLLDFGIAKLLEGGDLPLPTDATGTARPMTLTYASPEQVRGERVTTATDVYSLGVMLYRLLTGELPYRAQGAILQAILHEQPVRPSTRVGEEAARRRRASPRHLRRALAGDLDNVVLKALAKEPLERYGSAEELGADLERHLRGLPVAARPPSLPYRLGKLVRRNPALTAVSLAFLLAVLGFGAGMADLAGRLASERDRARELQLQAEEERDRALREEREADQVAALLVELFQAPDPAEARGEQVTAREVLDRGAERLGSELREQPEVRAALLDSVGRAYMGLGLYDSAESRFAEALELRRSQRGEDDAETLAILLDLAQARQAQGRFPDAEALLREALDGSRRLHGPRAPPVAGVATRLASVRRLQGDLQESEALLRRALEIYRRTGPDDSRTGDTLKRLADLLADRRELAEAERLYREALAVQTRELGADHPAVLTLQGALAIVLRYRGRPGEAEAIFRDVLRVQERVLGRDHPDVPFVLGGLASSLEDQGRPGEAEALYREALELRRRLLGSGHPAVAVSLYNLGHALESLGRLDEAEERYRDAVEIARQGFGEEFPMLAYPLGGLGRVAVARGRAAEGEAFLRQALALRRRILSDGDPLLALARSDLGECLAELGRFEEAEELLLASWRVLGAEAGLLERTRAEARSRLVGLYDRWGRPDEAARYRGDG